ncbi:hypothetical protein [Clostridium tetani]|nr:hypothetical protein [Clostridium tetani]BDR75258.1 hypothetical protein K154306013_09180 [Clostridium tetani]
MEIILISMLTCIAIHVSVKYSIKKVQAIKEKELDRADFIKPYEKDTY